jgi:hypothetical protein
MDDFSEVMAAIAILLIMLLIICAVIALPVMLIWNHALVDAVTWAKPVGFWQAFFISFLCGMLFKVSKSK